MNRKQKRDCLTRAEFEAEILLLTEEQHCKILGYGHYLIGVPLGKKDSDRSLNSSPLWQADDLVQQAIYAFLSGKRNCPREVDVFFAIKNAMRSIASHTYLQKVDMHADIMDCDIETESSEKPDNDAVFFVQSLLIALTDDLSAVRLIQGLYDQLTEREIAEKFDMTLGQVKAARKRVRDKALELEPLVKSSKI
jgi:DNA-directed RNA polymerase specialized sigma24 family protein